MPSDDILIACESETDSRLLQMILRAVSRDENITFLAVGQDLSPHMLFSPYAQPKGIRGGILGQLSRKAKTYRATIVVFDLKFGSPIQPAPYAARLSGLWLAPAVPSIESWLLADPSVFAEMSRDMREQVRETFDSYVVNNDHHFFNRKFLTALARRKIFSSYDPNRAAMLSPSLRSFFRIVDRARGGLSPEFRFSVPKAILSNLVLEYYPADRPIYRALDGSVYTGQDMAREIQEGTEVGRKYSSDLLRVCRDLLARQAENTARAAE